MYFIVSVSPSAEAYPALLGGGGGVACLFMVSVSPSAEADPGLLGGWRGG